MAAAKIDIEQQVLIVGACEAPGPALTHDLAIRGARVVVLDTSDKKLGRLARKFSDRIEPLAMNALDGGAFDRLGAAWADTPLQVVVNLMPLRAPRDVNGELHRLAKMLRATTRALAAGQGAFINVVSYPAEPLDLRATAMAGAFSSAQTALNKALLPRGVRMHQVEVAENAPNLSVPALRFLACASATGIAPQTLRLG